MELSAWVESKACAANFAHMDDPGAAWILAE